jgi:hypothetical protein
MDTWRMVHGLEVFLKKNVPNYREFGAFAVAYKLVEIIQQRGRRIRQSKQQ